MHKLFAAIVLACGLCHGDTVTMLFTSLPTVQMDGTYNGWAMATINGVPGQSVICDDYTHDTFIPSTVVFDYSLLTGPNPLQYARFSSKQTYEVAAVLVTEYAGLSHPSASTVTDYQYALWNLFEPSSAPATLAQKGLQSSAVSLVLANSPQATAAYDRLEIYTPVTLYASNQEFLEVSSAPEPGLGPLLAVLGITLIAARSWGRWRWRAARECNRLARQSQ
jgi:hypothetical protein